MLGLDHSLRGILQLHQCSKQLFFGDSHGYILSSTGITTTEDTAGLLHFVTLYYPARLTRANTIQADLRRSEESGEYAGHDRLAGSLPVVNTNIEIVGRL